MTNVLRLRYLSSNLYLNPFLFKDRTRGIVLFILEPHNKSLLQCGTFIFHDGWNAESLSKHKHPTWDSCKTVFYKYERGFLMIGSTAKNPGIFVIFTTNPFE